MFSFFVFFVFFTFVHVFVVIEFIVFWFFLFLFLLSLFVCCYSVLHMVNLLFTFSPILVFFYECFNVSSFSFSLFVRYVFTLACLCMFNRVSSCITRVYHLLYHYYSSYYRFVCYVLCLCLCSLCFTFTFIEQILLFVLTTWASRSSLNSFLLLSLRFLIIRFLIELFFFCFFFRFLGFYSVLYLCICIFFVYLLSFIRIFNKINKNNSLFGFLMLLCVFSPFCFWFLVFIWFFFSFVFFFFVLFCIYVNWSIYS